MRAGKTDKFAHKTTSLLKLRETVETQPFHAKFGGFRESPMRIRTEARCKKPWQNSAKSL